MWFQARGAGAAADGPPGSGQPPAQERGLQDTGCRGERQGCPPPALSHLPGDPLPTLLTTHPRAAVLCTPLKTRVGALPALGHPSVPRFPSPAPRDRQGCMGASPPLASQWHPQHQWPRCRQRRPIWVQTMVVCAEVSRCIQSRPSSLCQHYTIIS